MAKIAMDSIFPNAYEVFLHRGHKPGPFSYSEERNEMWNETSRITYTSQCKVCGRELKYRFKPVRASDRVSERFSASVNFHTQSVFTANLYIVFKRNAPNEVESSESKPFEQCCPRVASML